MKIKIECVQTGNEVVETFLAQLKQNNIEASAEEVKVEVFSEKKNEFVLVDAKNVRFSFSKE